MEYKNPQHTAFGGIDLELNHPDYGWIPFTATPDDVSEFGRALFSEILAKGQGHAAPYVGAPIEEILLDEWRQSSTVSTFQAQAMLDQAGYLDDIEALMKGPGVDRLTRLAWNKAQEFRRMSPTLLTLAAVLGISDEQLDDLFRFAATIEA